MTDPNNTRFKSPDDLREALHNAMSALQDGTMSPDEADDLLATAKNTNRDIAAEFSKLKDIIKSAKAAKRTRKATRGYRTATPAELKRETERIRKATKANRTATPEEIENEAARSRKAIQDSRTSRTRVFTDTWLRGKQPLTASEWADEPSPGLRLRVSPKGRKTFFYRYRLDGKIQKITIGVYPGTSLQEARDDWKELSNLRRRNIDPILHREDEAKEQRKAEIEAAQQNSYTIASLVKDYVDHVSKSKKSWKATDSILNRSLDPFMTTRADELTRGDVRHILTRLRDEGKPIMANRTLAAVRAMFNWAISEDWPTYKKEFLSTNPAWQVKATKENPCERALNDKELGMVLKALPGSGLDEDVQDVLLVTLLTGCRIGEACGMRWGHVFGDEWRIPGAITKNGKQHTVFLSDQAVAVLAKHEGGTHVFTSAGTHHGHLRPDAVGTDLRRALGVDTKIAKEDRVNSLGVDRFTCHDMRRSLATWLGDNEVDERIHDRMLNHYKATIAATYNTAKYNRPAREWWNNWGNHIQALTADNVVSLKKRGADHE